MYKILIATVIVGVLFIGCAKSQHQLEKMGTIKQAQAESIALASVPNGKIKETEIEKEKGLLVWSFDIATPGTEDITEVLIDAKTGKIVSTKIEKAAKEANEEEKEEKESPAQSVSLSDIPAPARAAIEKLTAGGKIKKIEKEEQEGTAIYDVEAKVKDKDVEYDVDSNGNILTSEESVPFSSMPAVVQEAAKTYFGSAEGLKASKEVEKDKTFYEVEGKKGGSAVALKLDDSGKILEEEK